MKSKKSQAMAVTPLLVLIMLKAERLSSRARSCPRPSAAPGHGGLRVARRSKLSAEFLGPLLGSVHSWRCTVQGWSSDPRYPAGPFAPEPAVNEPAPVRQ